MGRLRSGERTLFFLDASETLGGHVHRTSTSMAVCYDVRQNPVTTTSFLERHIGAIIGHYKLDDGRLFYAVR
jgi:hypothetical protein